MGFFDKLFNRADKQKEEVIPVKFDESRLEGFMRYEAARRAQGWDFTRFNEKTNPATVGSVLSNVMKDFMNHVVSMSVISTGEAGKTVDVKHVTDTSAIMNTKLFPLVRTTDDKREYIPLKGQNVTFVLKFSKEAPSREAVVFLRGIPGDLPGYTWCMRVTIMIPVIREDDNLHTGRATKGFKSRQESNAYPAQTSFIIFEDYNDITPAMKEFEKVESITLPKYKANQQMDNNLEWAIVRGVFEQYPTGAYIGFGRDLMELGRWQDAYNQLRRAYANMSSTVLTIPEEGHKIFYEVAYQIGICLQHMERYDEAAYYLWVSQNYNDLGLDELVKIYAKLCDLTLPQEYRSDAFIDEREDARIKLQFETSEAYSSNLTMGFMLGELFGAKPGNLTSLIVMHSGDTEARTFITDEQEVWNYPVRSLLEDDTTVIVTYSPVYHMSETIKDDSSLTQESSFLMRINTANEENGLMRVNIILPNFPYDDDKSFAHDESNTPDGISIIMSRETMRFRSIGKDPAEAWRVAKSLSEEGRFLEALHAIRYAYNHIISRWENISEEDRGLVYLCAYELGFCLMDFKLHSKANYYLRLAAASYNSEPIIEYLNSLANMNDIHTLRMIEEYEKVPNGDADIEEYTKLMKFLKRRKAFIYIEAERFDEARALLTQMAESNDEDDRKFAASELEYLNELMAHTVTAKDLT